MSLNKGFVLVFSLLIGLVIIAIIVSVAAISSGDLTLANRIANTTCAYYLADAGLSRKFAELRGGATGDISGTLTLSQGNTGTFNVTITTAGGGTFPTYILTSTGTYRNITKTLQLTVREMTYSRYIYLTDRETRSGTPIWFIGADIIRGPLHTNDRLNIVDDPTFEGPVSSVNSTINYYHGPPPLDNPDFRESLTLGAPRIQVPDQSYIINDIIAHAQDQANGGLYLNGDSTVTLLSNGTMNVTNTQKSWTNHNMPIPSNGALFVNGGNLYLSGILSGQLTVANQGSGKNIYIVNNILYANDPRINPSSIDMLGLVSGNNVIVASSAPYDLEVDGYILALNKSFYVEDYSTAMNGTLTLYGGVTQDERGAVGTFNSHTGQKVTGYTKDYSYDERFQGSAPALFPPAQDTNGRLVYLKTLWFEQ